jgi:hypothetical protein
LAALLSVSAAGFALHAVGREGRNVPNYPTGPIEKTYFSAGTWAVTYQPAFACCDSSGYAYDLWRPTALGKGGFLHPIITWGNGTGAPPDAYDYLLRHLASWGFVVIASRQPLDGSGHEILDAANYLVAENSRPGSPFKNRLAINQIGSMGHSQGAVGAMNAMQASAGLIKTTVSLAMPEQMYCPQMAGCANPSNLSDSAVFYVNGSLDLDISPSFQAQGTPGLQSNQAYYKATPKPAVKTLWGTLIGVSHSDPMGQPGCTGGDSYCTNGVYGFLGYPTAWMMDQLQNDAYAHAAFIKNSGEFFKEKANWLNQVGDIAQ